MAIPLHNKSQNEQRQKGQWCVFELETGYEHDADTIYSSTRVVQNQNVGSHSNYCNDSKQVDACVGKSNLVLL
jgi:hypothetical protein